VAAVFFEAEGVFGLLLFALWIYCILDVIATDNSLMRNLPKPLWLILVIMLPDVGSIAWIILGRPERAGFWPGDTRRRRPWSANWVARGPDDDPTFTPRSGPAPARPVRPTAPVEREAATAGPSADGSAGNGVSGDADAGKRLELERREAELKRQELEMWEQDLARREEEMRQRQGDGSDRPKPEPDDRPRGMYGT
jgi:hypothetical protein